MREVVDCAVGTCELDTSGQFSTMVAILTTTCVVNRKMLRRDSYTAVLGTAAETGYGMGGDEAAVIWSAIIDALCRRKIMFWQCL